MVSENMDQMTADKAHSNNKQATINNIFNLQAQTNRTGTSDLKAQNKTQRDQQGPRVSAIPKRLYTGGPKYGMSASIHGSMKK